MSAHQGTASLLALAEKLRTKAGHVADFWDHKQAAEVMRESAAALERLAPLDSDVDVVLGCD